MTPGHNGPPPPPLPPPPPGGVGGRTAGQMTPPRSTPTSPHGRPVASVTERIGSRAIDAAVFLPLTFVLVGIEALVRAVTGVEAVETDESGDWVTTSVGLLALLLLAAYDPLTSRFFGATPGKRALGRRVVRWSDDTPAGLLLLAGRSTLLVLEFLFLVPRRHRPAADRPAARRPQLGRPGDGYRRRQREGCSVRPAPADAVATRTMGRARPRQAEGARARLARTVAPVPPGPLHDRLQEIVTRVAACEAECVRVADRGVQLAHATAGADIASLRARAEQAGCGRLRCDEHVTRRGIRARAGIS